MKLIQKQFLKEVREFELKDDVVNFRVKTLFNEEKLTVVLTTLNPEPVVNKPFLEFHSRVKCGPLLSLRLDQPNPQTFNTFVSALKQRAREEYHAFAGFKANPNDRRATDSGETSANPDQRSKPINLSSIDHSIQMIEQNIEGEAIDVLVAALKALRATPEDRSCLGQLVTAFDAIETQQGAVLTHAPYVGVLLTDDAI